MNDLVSIIMPNYNSAKYVKATIESVLAQTYTNWELLFVDDCSTDNSLEIVRAFNDDRIRILQNEKNSGAAISRNYALREAKGRWIAFLDSDDLWEESKLTRHIAFMQKEDIAFSFTDYSVINDDNELITQFKPKKEIYDYKAILKHCAIGCSTVIYDKNQLDTVYMPENAIKREDFACWLTILRNGTKGVCLHDSLTKYRVHSNSVSSNKCKMIKYQWNVYRKLEKLNIFQALYYIANWGIRGLLKYK